MGVMMGEPVEEPSLVLSLDFSAVRNKEAWSREEGRRAKGIQTSNGRTVEALFLS